MFGISKLYMCLCVLAAANAKPGRLGNDVDFVSTRLTPDGEFEVRLSFEGIQAMETVIPELGEQGLFYREATNGNQIVHSIYQNRDLLIDCDVSRDEDDLKKFSNRFLGTTSRFGDAYGHTGNLTIREITGPLEDEYKPLVNFHQLKTECRELHRYLRRERKARQHANSGNDLAQGSEDTPWPLDDEDADDANLTPNDLESQHSDRVKRAMLIYPGTNWCGTGNTAATYHDLGENVATDKCCRAHDHCPYMIAGFTTKYNMFNYRFHTLSHCTCDEAFRSCLKNAGNSVANMVGSLFFNVVGTKCFVLKPEKSCLERSWWGKCINYSRQYTAYIEEPEEY